MDDETVSLIDIFDDRVRQTPDEAAVRWAEKVFSFAELDAAVERVREEVEPHVRTAQVIAVMAHRSLASLTDLLAVLRLSKAYVPVDPAAPPLRRQRQLADAGTTILLDQGRIEHTGVSARQLPDGLAYIIYTSGSSGEPKGCLVSHRNVRAMLAGTLPCYQVGRKDIWSLFHRFTFDVSVWELWGCWLTGGSIRLLSEAEARSPALLADAVDAAGVTVLSLVPSAFRQLSGTHGDLGRPVPKSLRYLIFAGERIDSAELVAFDRMAQSPLRYINHYGPTETTVFATMYEMEPAEEVSTAGSVIGRALTHLEIELWPPDGEGATDTDHGEIVIAGAGVCQGYLGRPELNAARFVEVRERCWYRSGDLAERDEWGLLRYQGRLDEQVKVQGYRIELGEIEAVLRGVPGIKDCAAIVESGPAGGRIVVFCVSELSEGEVSTLVKARSVEYLPRYMHPRRVKVVSELHYTGSGKVDKRTLRQ